MITKRGTKGSPLSIEEMDANWSALAPKIVTVDDDKIERGVCERRHVAVTGVRFQRKADVCSTTFFKKFAYFRMPISVCFHRVHMVDQVRPPNG